MPTAGGASDYFVCVSPCNVERTCNIHGLVGFIPNYSPAMDPGWQPPPPGGPPPALLPPVNCKNGLPPNTGPWGILPHKSGGDPTGWLDAILTPHFGMRGTRPKCCKPNKRVSGV
jgi:hypothetical protein